TLVAGPVRDRGAGERVRLLGGAAGGGEGNHQRGRQGQRASSLQSHGGASFLLTGRKACPRRPAPVPGREGSVWLWTVGTEALRRRTPSLRSGPLTRCRYADRNLIQPLYYGLDLTATAC